MISYGNAGGEPGWQLGQPELYRRGLSVSGFSILGRTADAPGVLREIADRGFQLVTSGQVELPITRSSRWPRRTG